MKALPLLACCLALAAHGAYAKATPTNFSHEDWELACDNTRTCRAAGYSADSEDKGISVLLTRQAGSAGEVTGQIQTSSIDDENPCPSHLRMAGMPANAATIALKNCEGKLSLAQVQHLLAMSPKNMLLDFSSGTKTWRLSLKGSQAVFLKTDELQGRLNTPSAWVRKGSQPEQSALPALPAPVITIPEMPSAKLPNEAALLKAIQPALQSAQEGCDENKLAPQNLKLEQRLNDRQILVSHPCWLAAYNDGAAFWVVNLTPPYQPRLVTTDGSVYGKGVISEEQKGRGVGDCWSHRSWAWNGTSFVPAKASSTGMCRRIAAGGTWDLPTHVSTIRYSKK